MMNSAWEKRCTRIWRREWTRISLNYVRQSTTWNWDFVQLWSPTKMAFLGWWWKGKTSKVPSPFSVPLDCQISWQVRMLYFGKWLNFALSNGHLTINCLGCHSFRRHVQSYDHTAKPVKFRTLMLVTTLTWLLGLAIWVHILQWYIEADQSDRYYFKHYNMVWTN